MKISEDLKVERWADSRETSWEIARAILEMAISEAAADAIWEDPSIEEFSAANARAWQLAPEGAEVLFWGEERIRNCGI